MRTIILGNGKMGQIVARLLGDDLVEIIDTLTVENLNLQNADCIIDFSHPTTIQKFYNQLASAKIPILIATTGQNKEQLELIQKLSLVTPVLLARNTSYGVSATYLLIEQAIKYFETYDIEIIEKHHKYKIDSPSGTALYLAEPILKYNEQYSLVNGNHENAKNDMQIGVHSIRSGGVFGEHTIIFSNDYEQIEITHKALNRDIFANGAINMARKLIQKEIGLYDPLTILNSKENNNE